ncbi:MAG: hypothetical protein H6745_29920 [Deltaproteobacteria bacterium]|nr:hypothetical protein [Deltaproteobacteria bacterium]
MQRVATRLAALVLAGAIAAAAAPARAQVAVDGSGSATIDFAAFTGAGFAPDPAAGALDSDAWSVLGMSDGDLAFGGTATSGDLARGASSGGVSTGGVYAFDTGTEIALGFQPGGSDVTPGALVLKLRNDTGAAVTGLAVTGTLWVFNDQGRSSTWAMSWSDDDGATWVPFGDVLTTTVTAMAPAIWVDTPLVGAAGGLAVPPGATFLLRFDTDDAAGSGSRDELGLGAFTVTTSRCGDGVVGVGEVCEQTEDNASTCDTDCTEAVCGDGLVNAFAGEACDDGGESATCNADCRAATCGDGVVNATAGESCDPGQTVLLDTGAGGDNGQSSSSGSAWRAETFTLGAETFVGGVQLPVRAEAGGCTGMVVELVGTVGGAPDVASVLASATIGADAPPFGSTTTVRVPFELLLPAGQYAVVLKPVAGNGFCVLQLSTDDPYAGGVSWLGQGDPQTLVAEPGVDLHVQLLPNATGVVSDDCAPTCRPVGICGDGVVDAELGELCDPGPGIAVDTSVGGNGQSTLGSTLVRAQVFTLAAPVDVAAIDLETGGGACEGVAIAITALTVDGAPDRAAVLATGAITPGQSQLKGTWLRAPFAAALDAGSYAVVLDLRDVDGCGPRASSDDPYPGGSWWTTTNSDPENFREYADTDMHVRVLSTAIAHETAACDSDCTPAECGDGTINAAARETCDDGGESATCDATCTEAACGDGTVNATAGETCDDGVAYALLMTLTPRLAVADSNDLALAGGDLLVANDQAGVTLADAQTGEPLGTLVAPDSVPAFEDCATTDDEDRDGDAGCADSDCAGTAACATGGEVCDNFDDDDGDGLIDCADADCKDTALCYRDLARASVLAVSPDGGSVIVAATDGGLYRFDTVTGAFLGMFSGENRLWSALAFGPDGDLYAAAERELLRFDGTGEVVEATPLDGYAIGLGFSSGGEPLVTFISGGLVRLDAGTGAVLASYDPLMGPVAAIAPDGDGRVWLASFDGPVVRMDLATATVDATLARPADLAGWYHALALRDDATLLALQAYGGIVDAYRLEGNSDTRPGACRTDCVAATCGDGVTDPGETCDDGGESLVCNADCSDAACGDGVWNATAGEGCDGGGETAACDGDCSDVVCGDGYANAAAGEACDDGAAGVTAFSRAIGDVVTDVTAAGTLVVVATESGVRLLDGPDGQPAPVAWATPVTAVTTASNGVVYGWGATVGLVELVPFDGTVVRTLAPAGGARLVSLTVGFTGDVFGVDGDAGTVLRYDGTTGAESTFVALGSGSLTRAAAVAMAPDGVLLVLDATTGTVRCYSGTTGSPIGAIVASAGTDDMAVGPDGLLYVAAFGNGIARYDAVTGLSYGKLSAGITFTKVAAGATLAYGARNLGRTLDGVWLVAGNSDSEPDACRTDCAAAGCGDGVVDTGEACDDGAGNSDTAADACRTTCEAAGCGDDVIDAGEACDDGFANSDTDADACRTDCTAARCGDGAVDTGEACDDGAGNSDTAADACRVGCVAPRCGDGVTDTGEACDDGADNSDSAADACRTSCEAAGCGDGVLDSGEACDDGADNSDTAADACRTSCAAAGCGDGVLDSGEACDDGADNSDSAADACRTSCEVATCGDGVVDGGEACDDGADNSDSAADACRTSCVAAGCGDGVVDAGEACDDGGDNSDSAADACRTTCEAAGCGDGVVDAGEACDDGAGNSDSASGACRTTCELATCGDGVVDAGEACDDGAGNSDTEAGACRTSCETAGCGDGVVDAGEACDDGAGNSDTEAGACRTSCEVASCGDGVVDPGEACDGGEGCSAACEVDDEPNLEGGGGCAAGGGAGGELAWLALGLALLLWRRRRQRAAAA